MQDDQAPYYRVPIAIIFLVGISLGISIVNYLMLLVVVMPAVVPHHA